MKDVLDVKVLTLSLSLESFEDILLTNSRIYKSYKTRLWFSNSDVSSVNSVKFEV